MRSDITEEQFLLLDDTVTRPIYLIEIDAGGQEKLSTGGDVTVGEDLYHGGSAGLRALDDWSAARIVLPATAERVQQVIDQDWRRGRCDIYLVAAGRFPLLLDQDYVEEDYFMQGDVYAAPLLLLPGVLTGASYGNSGVEFEVQHVSRVAKWSPAVRIAPPVFNHLPRPGTVISWAGEQFVLEAR